MIHRKLRQVWDGKVAKWLRENIPEITTYQKEKIDAEFVRDMPFYLFEKRDSKQGNILWRLSLIPYLVMYVILVLGLPFNFLITGEWGYVKIEWMMSWSNRIFK